MRLVPAALLVTLLGSGGLSLEAQEGGLRLASPSFIFARWGSRSASSLYAGYTMGQAAVFFGIVSNPRSGYRELLCGVTTQIVWGKQAVTTGVAYADASDSRYLQIYLVPSLAAAGLDVSGTLELYAPLDIEGTWQLDVNPMALVLRPLRRLGLGAAYAAGFGEGASPRHRAGALLELSLPRGAVKVEVLRNFVLSYYDVRMSVEAGF